LLRRLALLVLFAFLASAAACRPGAAAQQDGGARPAPDLTIDLTPVPAE
jgi:hypothetical protein